MRPRRGTVERRRKEGTYDGGGWRGLALADGNAVKEVRIHE